MIIPLVFSSLFFVIFPLLMGRRFRVYFLLFATIHRFSLLSYDNRFPFLITIDRDGTASIWRSMSTGSAGILDSHSHIWLSEGKAWFLYYYCP